MPICVAEAVFDQAGIVPREVTETTGQPGPSAHEAAIDESKLSPFKEFIDTLDIDDLAPAAGETRL